MRTTKRHPGVSRHDFIVDTPGFFGVVSIDDTNTVVSAIPPLRFMVGMTGRELEAYCKTRGYGLRPVV